MHRYAFLVAMVFHCSIACAQDLVRYYITAAKDGSQVYTLMASVKGKGDISLLKDECLSIETINDWDGDGRLDVLVRENSGCGRCNGFSFHLFSYRGDTLFAYSPILAQSPLEVSFTHKDNFLYFNASNMSCTGYSSRFEEWTEVYRLKEGRAVLEKRSVQDELPAMIEIRKEAFESANQFLFDLDGDGQPDLVELSTWGILETMEIVVHLQGKEHKFQGYRRIGILPQQTKGIYDLIIDYNEQFSWNGSEYVPRY